MAEQSRPTGAWPSTADGVLVLSALVLAVWAAIALLNTFTEVLGEPVPGSAGAAAFFDGLHEGSPGLLGAFDAWWYDGLPLGGHPNLFQLALAGTGILAVVGLVTNPALVRVAGVLAIAQLVVFALVWVPIRDSFLSWGDFVLAVVLGALVPVGAAIAILSRPTTQR